MARCLFQFSPARKLPASDVVEDAEKCPDCGQFENCISREWSPLMALTPASKTASMGQPESTSENESISDTGCSGVKGM